MSNEDRKQKICEDLALLKVFKVMCQHDLDSLSNAQILLPLLLSCYFQAFFRRRFVSGSFSLLSVVVPFLSWYNRDRKVVFLWTI